MSADPTTIIYILLLQNRCCEDGQDGQKNDYHPSERDIITAENKLLGRVIF